MNAGTYLQGYIYKLKPLHSRVDEVGKLMLSNKLCMYIRAYTYRISHNGVQMLHS